jgi:A/G-specific adenine glycosylase
VNVRRVAARAVTGVAAPGPATTPADLATVEALLPGSDAAAARLSAALMELGAVICVARTPRCADCPITSQCAWRAAGSPADEAPARRSQKYEGTDRFVRGLILAELRAVPDPVPASRVDLLWHLPEQRDRALASLLADGLVARHGAGHYTLPSGSRQR